MSELPFEEGQSDAEPKVALEPIWGEAVTPEALGELVAVLRARRGLTQAELAEAARSADVTRRFVNELEGGRSTIYVRRLFAVLQALDVRLILAEREATPRGLADSGDDGVTRVTPELVPPLRNLGW